MKTIGMIGGLSWESSLLYYRILNETVKERMGGAHSARCLMFSFDFAEIEALQMADDWEAATFRMTHAARQLERGGADGLIICSNTMHRMADDVQNAIDIPLLHIVDATASAIQATRLTQVGLLGTRFTMEHEFFRARLLDRFDIQTRIPEEPQRSEVHRVIYEELIHGVIREESRAAYVQTIESLAEQGMQGVILGCTEIGMLIEQEHSPLPVFDTTRLHAEAAVDWALD